MIEFKEGDVVEIVNHEMPNWNGYRAVVVEGGNSMRPKLSGIGDRPDGYWNQTFYWFSRGLIQSTPRVGDTVMVIKDPTILHRDGHTGVVQKIYVLHYSSRTIVDVEMSDGMTIGYFIDYLKVTVPVVADAADDTETYLAVLDDAIESGMIDDPFWRLGFVLTLTGRAK